MRVRMFPRASDLGEVSRGCCSIATGAAAGRSQIEPPSRHSLGQVGSRSMRHNRSGVATIRPAKRRDPSSGTCGSASPNGSSHCPLQGFAGFGRRALHRGRVSAHLSSGCSAKRCGRVAVPRRRGYSVAVAAGYSQRVCPVMPCRHRYMRRGSCGPSLAWSCRPESPTGCWHRPRRTLSGGSPSNA